MITAKGEEADKVEGLECGADDYVTKPFGMMELIARVKAVIRRCAGRGEGVLTLGGIRLDREKHTVEADGKEVVLTFREFELLRYLMEHPEKAFDRDRLLDEVWGAEYEGGAAHGGHARADHPQKARPVRFADRDHLRPRLQDRRGECSCAVRSGAPWR